MIVEVITSHFRTDGVNIKISHGESYMNIATGEVVKELPEDAVAAEWATIATVLRKDQTGEVYETVHDVEGSSNTYTELYMFPDSYCEKNVSTSVPYNKNVYPTYKSAETYSEGDIVTENGRTWISTMNDNTGYTPSNLWGWDMYLPYIEVREQHYGTYEEVFGNARSDEAGN